MSGFRALALATFTLACLALPLAASASQKCLCENGEITHAMDDDEDACEDACDMFGGGRKWTPEDAAYDTDVNVDENRRPTREGVEEHPASRR